jgi:butyrate kinase
MIKYIAASVKKQGCQVIEVENVEPEDGILTERRAVLPVADFVGACLCNRRPCGTG